MNNFVAFFKITELHQCTFINIEKLNQICIEFNHLSQQKVNALSIATLNKKHFERIDELLVIG